MLWQQLHSQRTVSVAEAKMSSTQDSTLRQRSYLVFSDLWYLELVIILICPKFSAYNDWDTNCITIGLQRHTIKELPPLWAASQNNIRFFSRCGWQLWSITIIQFTLFQFALDDVLLLYVDTPKFGSNSPCTWRTKIPKKPNQHQTENNLLSLHSCREF